MRKADIISSAVIIALGLTILFVVIPIWVPGHLAGNYGLRAQDFPILTATVIVTLAAGLLAHRLFGKARPADEDSPDEDTPPITPQSWRFLAIAAAVLIAIWLLLDQVGFIAGAPFGIAVFMVMMGERRPLHVIPLAILAPLAVWVLFWKILHFPLP